MSDRLIDTINRLFSFLFEEYAFNWGKQERSESFSDSYTTLESDDFILRFVSDRGQLFIQLGSRFESGRWFELNIIRAFVLGVDCLEVKDIEDLAILLRENYYKIKELMSRKNVMKTIKQLEKLEEARAKRMFPGFFS